MREEECGETERSCSLGTNQGIPQLGDCSGLPFFRGTWTIKKDKVAGKSGLGVLPAALEAFPTPVNSWAVLGHSLDAASLLCVSSPR